MRRHFETHETNDGANDDDFYDSRDGGDANEEGDDDDRANDDGDGDAYR